MTIEEKKEKLDVYLRELGSVAVAFSAGVDSTFLLKTAHDLLGERVIALTVRSAFFPARETLRAEEFCRQEGISQTVADFDPLGDAAIRANPANRCYLCKKAMFARLIDIAREQGFRYIAEGSNADDEDDFRPGLAAIRELGVKSPLSHAGLTKADIRELSRRMCLETWDRPSYACLASRFVYREEIGEERLSMVDLAEQWLLDRGFRQVRVRIHSDIARIELEAEDMRRLIDLAGQTESYMRSLGFRYVTMDLGGYRSGSMNRPLDV